MLDTPQKQQEHHRKMLKLVFATRISFAISTPMQIPTQRWYVREEYRYKKMMILKRSKKCMTNSTINSAQSSQIM
jgi:hypothetical protein